MSRTADRLGLESGGARRVHLGAKLVATALGLSAFMLTFAAGVARAQPTEADDYGATSCVTALEALLSEPTDDSHDGAGSLTETAATCNVYLASYVAARSSLTAEQRARGDDEYARLASAWAHVQVELGGDCAGALRTLSEIAHALDSIPPAAQSSYARASHLALSCPPPPTPPSHGGVVLSPGDEPTTLTGVAGGFDDAATRFSGACMGAIPRTPSHTFEVTEAMTVGIAIFADYDEDLTLVVTGPDGALCNDDHYGLNPGISAELTPGTYEVYVGEFTATGMGAGYEVTFFSHPLHDISFGALPTYGTAVLTPAGIETASGVSGGSMSARVFGSSCVGDIAEAPNHRLVVSEYGRATIQVTAVTASDLTLVVTGPGGTFCNNDFVGFDPAISEWMAAGSYDVYVGDRLSAEVAYNIRFSDEDLYAVEVGVLTPQFGTAEISAGSEDILLPGVAGGLQSAADRFGPDCRGTVSWEPNHTFYLDEDQEVWIEAGASSGGDLTLVLIGPWGTRCNDDFRGRDPGLMGLLEAGTYDVYVGEFAPSFTGTSYGLRIATTEPADPVAPAPTSFVFGPDAIGTGGGSAHGQFSFWGLTQSVDSATYRFGSDCAGFIPGFPSGVVVLSEPAQLTISARSGPMGDLVLAVSGPDGAICNDDFDSVHPQVSGWFPAGTVEIYVGEFTTTPMGTAFSAEVEATTRTAAPTPELPPPAPVEPTRVVVGEEPVVQLGMSGGLLRARRFGAECAGYLPEAPSFIVVVGSASSYEISVQADGDTTLVVDGPGGPFCNDDFDDFDPAVHELFAPGRYEIYVGSYNPRLRHNFRITFSRTEASPESPERP